MTQGDVHEEIEVMSAARRLSTRVVSDQELLMAEPLVNMPCQD